MQVSLCHYQSGVVDCLLFNVKDLFKYSNCVSVDNETVSHCPIIDYLCPTDGLFGGGKRGLQMDYRNDYNQERPERNTEASS